MAKISLTKRQTEILKEFKKRPNEYFSANEFANKMNVSHRTIQSDFKQLKEVFSCFAFASLESTTSKGTKLVISNMQEFNVYFDNLTKEKKENALSYQLGRVNKLLLYLLKNRKSISLQSLADVVFVSKSTILKDLNEVDKVLMKYQLNLIRKDHYHIWVDGLEKDKRMCLLDKDLYFTGTFEQDRLIVGDEQRIHMIKKILVNVLVEQQYKISDIELQNLIVIMNITLKRVADGFYIEEEMNSLIGNDFEKEKIIARKVFEELSLKFQIHVRDVEINYFAVNLNSKGDHENQSYISKDLNDFIFNSLITIKREFGIDLIDNVDLRISLALHCVPLITRLKYDLQLKNTLLFHIKQMSPLAFEVGTYFGYLLQKKYKKRINDDEIAFFAIYFNSGLLNLDHNKEVSSVLVISSVKRSESFLLEQILRQWFPNDIGKIEFLSIHEFSEIHLDLYDIILTTEKNSYYEKGVALLINLFPNKRDFYRLKVYIEGFKSIDDVIGMFRPELFIKGAFLSRHEILEKMSKRATDEYGVENLYEEVLVREELGSTYFGNYVAIPHPMHSIASNSFISVALLDKPIEWDEDKNTVRMVLLVCVEKNNTQAFKIWNYVSKMISDHSFLDEILVDLSYQHFVQVLEKSLRSWFTELR